MESGRGKERERERGRREEKRNAQLASAHDVRRHDITLIPGGPVSKACIFPPAASGDFAAIVSL